MPRADRFADAVAIAAVLFLVLDPTAHGAQIAFMLFSAATATLLAWLLVRYVLRSNLLAYPLAVALATLLSSAATLLQNHRVDLIANGVIVLIVAIALAIWVAYPRLEHA